MFRFWAKEWKHGHVVRQTTVEDDSQDTRTHKVFHAMTQVCREFDLPEPIWLEKNIKDFQRHAKCRFNQDSFIEEIPFDWLEVEIVEEEDFFS